MERRGLRIPGWFVVAGAGFVAGVACCVGPRLRSPETLPAVRAASSLAEGSFATCTVPLDGFEGLFLLDFETGDLSGGILKPATGKFTGLYKTNVLKDLGFKPGQAKNPKFLLVSGIANVTRLGPLTLSPSALFVTDSATGTTVAYGIPSLTAPAAGAFAELVRLDVVNPRGGGKTR
ncbi:MAG: hypothetical protein FJ309_02755 [Planctomycetes bacterium]|nr:hypothetical protein [Planctomycetota bacterium]MBM4057721.1 hypothetical protein [Planctomycetota bacterium]